MMQQVHVCCISLAFQRSEKMTEKRLNSITISSGSAFDAESLSNLRMDSGRADIERLLETVLTLQQSSLGHIDIFKMATDAVVEMIGLNEGLVVAAKPNGWNIIASSSRNGSNPKDYSKQILERVVTGKKTFFESVATSSETKDTENRAFVASPIFDNSDRVVGVLFGSRKMERDTGQCEIPRLEALLLQLIAGVISSTIICEDRRAEASHLQTQLEQFESPKLVQALKDDSDILEAREREVTVLFSDIRGFTGLTERVGTEKTFAMIRNLMNQLTGCILDEEGFIMGYAGDGISAMWNGLSDQPDHAELACWAAVNMQKEMAKLKQFWNFLTGEQLEARIGISTGTAHVGNVGSRWRLHYSALGSCVNLASRLEAANKFFGSSILMDDSTKNALFSRFNIRRIGPVIVKGADQATNVYELLGEANRAVPQFVQEYETALSLFEAREFASAQQAIASSVEQNVHHDLAAAELLAQIQSQLSNSSNLEPAIRLSSK